MAEKSYDENQIITLRDNAKNELLQIRTIEDGMTRLNKLKSIEVWVRAEKKDAQLQNIISEQKLRTQRILGTLLKEIISPNLNEIGITKELCSAFKKVAEMPLNVFEGFIAGKDVVSHPVTLKLSRPTSKEDENSIKERQLITYPHPKYHKFFIAECHGRLAGKSEHLKNILKSHYDKMTPQEINALNLLWNEMTDEQRKNPNRA